jgi:sarcosine oxidase, subunit beta
VARIVIAGAGAIGASIAYQLALRGARDVILCDVAQVASGATAKAMGGVRQQFLTRAEVELARRSVRFFEQELGPPLFLQVGYLFLATTDEGAEELERRRELLRSFGVPVKRAQPTPSVYADDVRGAIACWEDGVADPTGVTRELVRRAADLGVEVRENTDALVLPRDLLVLATGAWSRSVGERVGLVLPIRPLVRQLVDVGPVDEVEPDLPMTIELETGFHFRHVDGNRLRLAMPETETRWDGPATVRDDLVADWLGRLAHRVPSARHAGVIRAWAGLYDMTPDAHPIIGWVGDGVYAACGFSGHGFMQCPAVGEAAAAELLGLDAPFDLSPYRVQRFAEDEVFPESLVL